MSKSIECYVVRPFLYDGKTQKRGAKITLPIAFFKEMEASGKVSEKPVAVKKEEDKKK